jgi:UDP-galactose transporter B1
VAQFPDILNDLMIFGLLSGIGQIFIFRGASILGTLTLNIITTTRKFMTVMLSIILFEHTLNLYQWLSLVLVFSGTMIDFYMQFFGKPKPKKHEDIESAKSKE